MPKYTKILRPACCFTDSDLLECKPRAPAIDKEIRLAREQRRLAARATKLKRIEARQCAFEAANRQKAFSNAHRQTMCGCCTVRAANPHWKKACSAFLSGPGERGGKYLVPVCFGSR
jgi:hypothetical protein